MNKYIFLTFEGFTQAPNVEEIENIQMIGISQGYSKKEAFEKLKEENDWLLETSFDEIYCHKLKDKSFDFFY